MRDTNDDGRALDPQGEDAEQLFQLLHDELHGMARRCMAGQDAAHTLQPTALVNEAWLRLAGNAVPPESRAHFLAVAAAAMRSVLVDHARRKLAGKRGGGARPLRISQVPEPARDGPQPTVLDLHEALVRLATLDGQAARVAEMRLFAAMEYADVARVLGVSLSTVERLWRTARAHMARLLEAAE